MNPDIDHFKAKAAHSAVSQIRSGMVVGLGTGSTVRFALERIGEMIKKGELRDIAGIPSSVQTERISRQLGIPLSSLEQHPEIDINIDGADEVDPGLNLIKGGGGALLHEKVLAQASKRNVIIVDESKLSPQLGIKWAVPVEVIPFAWKTEAGFLTALLSDVTVRRSKDGHLFKTDEGNLILDCNFGPIADPGVLAAKMNQRAGIVEHGLFLGLAAEVIVAGEKGIRSLGR